MIISRGSDLPFILVMLGVFGGVVAFGFIGVFLGPVLLALGFVLIKEWAAPAALTARRQGHRRAPSLDALRDRDDVRSDRRAERHAVRAGAFGDPRRGFASRGAPRGRPCSGGWRRAGC